MKKRRKTRAEIIKEDAERSIEYINKYLTLSEDEMLTRMKESVFVDM